MGTCLKSLRQNFPPFRVWSERQRGKRNSWWSLIFEVLLKQLPACIHHSIMLLQFQRLAVIVVCSLLRYYPYCPDDQGSFRLLIFNYSKSVENLDLSNWSGFWLRNDESLSWGMLPTSGTEVQTSGIRLGWVWDAVIKNVQFLRCFVWGTARTFSGNGDPSLLADHLSRALSYLQKCSGLRNEWLH